MRQSRKVKKAEGNCYIRIVTDVMNHEGKDYVDLKAAGEPD